MLRIGTDTGSITNYLMSSTSGQPVPVAGMGVTILSWTDRSAATVVRVSASGKMIWIQPDAVTRTDTNGMSESQQYSYAPDPDAQVIRASLRKNGAWVTKGGQQLRLGERSAYYDYSF